MKFKLRARLTAEFVGGAFLVAAVIGSGIMRERLAGAMSPSHCLPLRLRKAWVLTAGYPRLELTRRRYPRGQNTSYFLALVSLLTALLTRLLIYLPVPDRLEVCGLPTALSFTSNEPDV